MSTARLKVMFIGDSITAGTGGQTNLGGYSAQTAQGRLHNGVTWRRTGTLTLGYDDSLFSGGIGFRIDQMLVPTGLDLTTFKPDIVVMHVGTNDATQRVSGGVPTLATSQASLTTLLDAVRAAKANCVVFFAQIVPNTDAATDAVITTQNAAFVTQIGLRSDAALISIVDQNAAIKANAAWATQWMSDTTHPNYRGYNVMAAAWRAALTAAGY